MATAAHTTTTEAHTTALQAVTFTRNLEQLAANLGRLRRRLKDDPYASHLIDRLATGIDGLDAFLWPSAAELVQTGLEPAQALERVDRRARAFRELLGEATR